MATKELGNIPHLIDDDGWTEPESAANTSYQPVYPYNNVKQTEAGHLFEMDDTPTRERIRLQHGKGLTFVEMHPNGDQVHKVFGDDYEITIKNKNVLIKGACNVQVVGDCNLKVDGDYNIQVGGDYNVLVGGKMKTRVVGDLKFDSDSDVSISASENFGGQIRMAAADNMTLTSDLVVNGAIYGDLITSQTRVDAGTGVSAGPFGFVSLNGGLSLGVPVAVPGTVIAIKSGYFGFSVTTPLLSSIISTNILGSSVGFYDLLNWAIEYSTHYHTGVMGGPGTTGLTPEQPMQTC
jgi:hypothetical protein